MTISADQARVLARIHEVRAQSGSYPSQRALASDLGLTHGVVRRALTDLIALGLLAKAAEARENIRLTQRGAEHLGVELEDSARAADLDGRTFETLKAVAALSSGGIAPSFRELAAKLAVPYATTVARVQKLRELGYLAEASTPSRKAAPHDLRLTAKALEALDTQEVEMFPHLPARQIEVLREVYHLAATAAAAPTAQALAAVLKIHHVHAGRHLEVLVTKGYLARDGVGQVVFTPLGLARMTQDSP